MRSALLTRAALLLLLLPLPPAPVAAHEAHRGHGAAPGSAADDAAEAPPRRGPATDEATQRAWFTDLPLVTQDGEAVRFYTDVLKDRLVLVSFIFTSCEDACPLLMGSLVEVERLLGDRSGGVRFVAISVDPETDTPEVLRGYAGRWRTGPGWVYLTGKKENVDRVVYRLGQYTGAVEDHSTLFLLGDVAKARWRKVRGNTPPELVAYMLEDLLQGR
jgi:protein SCO1